MSVDRNPRYDNLVAVDRNGKVLMSDGTGDCGKHEREFDIFARSRGYGGICRIQGS